MSVTSFQCNLTAHRPRGIVTSDEFLVPLTAEAGGLIAYAVADRPAGTTGIIAFQPPRLDVFTGAERHDHFQAAVAAQLNAIGVWLLPRAPALLHLRSNDVRPQFIVELWMNQDQMDLHLPAALLGSLAAANVEIYILSNE